MMHLILLGTDESVPAHYRVQDETAQHHDRTQILLTCFSLKKSNTPLVFVENSSFLLLIK